VQKCYDKFAVTDTGIGIQRKLASIFDNFNKLQWTSRIYGTGLGLAIVKQLVEPQGGGKSVGEGTTFSFRLSFKNNCRSRTEAKYLN
jgi:signal transduction histidine kinase